MTDAHPLQAQAQAILDKMQDAYACRMPRNFQEIAVKAVVYALELTRHDAAAPHGNQRPILLPSGRPMADEARDACLAVLGQRLFKFADVIQALVINGVSNENRTADKIAEKLLLQYRRRGLVVSAGRRGYWQSVEIDQDADHSASVAPRADNDGPVEILRHGLIAAASDFQLIVLQADTQSMGATAQQGRDRALLSLVEAA